jgi:pyruvate formate lyase activating enzyme
MPSLIVGGLVPLSMGDYPGRLSAVVFCQGCPWRCGYCHNTHLLPQRGDKAIPWKDVSAFLERRRGLLDAVVFSGGEPTWQPGLEPCLAEAKGMGFAIGLHTGGARPDRLRQALPWLDWVGLDIKADFPDYGRITGARGSGEKARASLELLLKAGIAFECRTTVYPPLLPPRAIPGLARSLAGLGVRHYAVQEYRSPDGPSQGVSCEDPRSLKDACAGLDTLFETFTLRLGR